MTLAAYRQAALALFYLLAVIHPAGGTIDPADGCEYWVAPPPAGNDKNPGTANRPWATLQQANKKVPDKHCTVWFRPGVYKGVNRLNRRFETPTTFAAVIPYRAVLTGLDSVLTISGAKNVTLTGFDIRHSGPGAAPLLIAIDGSDEGWAEYVKLRNNLIHDSYNNDLLKVYNLARFITIENNIFYNQGPPEEHLDINSVTDVVIQDNIFFNAYEASGRPNHNQSKQFIVIKDSNGAADGLVGSRRVTVRRNIFLNWQGQDDETFIQVGLDGKPYFEAQDIRIENNLLIGNSNNRVGAAFGVRGARNVHFVNNTVVGDLPALAYATRVTITEQNPKNRNITFYNNIWSDPTGTMGSGLDGEPNEFADGDPDESLNLVLDRNLYWNGPSPIPGGDLFSPLKDDKRRIVRDPRLAARQKNLVLPLWVPGKGFLSGRKSIRAEFVRLAKQYGEIPQSSPAVNKADASLAPRLDLLKRRRDCRPDLGALEFQFASPCKARTFRELWRN